MADVGKVLRDEESVVESASANMLSDGGKRDDDGGRGGIGWGTSKVGGVDRISDGIGRNSRVNRGNGVSGKSSRENRVKDFSERTSEGADGVKFKIVDEVAEEAVFEASDEDRRKRRAMGAGGDNDRLAIRTNVAMLFDYVIFTTVTKWASQSATTPTRVGREKV